MRVRVLHTPYAPALCRCPHTESSVSILNRRDMKELPSKGPFKPLYLPARLLIGNPIKGSVLEIRPSHVTCVFLRERSSTLPFSQFSLFLEEAWIRIQWDNAGRDQLLDRQLVYSSQHQVSIGLAA
ncbi:hypothetical protein DPEC_G00161540 [Dallia pectoralis]|uniref:Uncharacterized protein n=1 Tax=Dallia pectoralis TaxID=75939 RepID=A0ACC2GG89_DALPE|nr:hypothetical protein DPEC_G00161540 [Dallia pectoralis]